MGIRIFNKFPNNKKNTPSILNGVFNKFKKEEYFTFYRLDRLLVKMFQKFY